MNDEHLAEVLVSRAAEAHRLATKILRDSAAAEDAVQEAALAAWKGRSKIRNADNLAGWFTTIVVNV